MLTSWIYKKVNTLKKTNLVRKLMIKSYNYFRKR